MSRTPLEEIAAVLLTGLAVTAATLGVLVVVRVTRPGWMPDPGRWLTCPDVYPRTHYRLICRTVVAELLVAAIIVILAARSLNNPNETKGIANRVSALGRQIVREDLDRHVAPFPPLWTLAREKAGKDRVAVLSILLKDGRRVTGRVGAFLAEATGDDMDIALETPVQVVHPNGHAVTLADDPSAGNWKFLFVRAPEIVDIAIRYDACPEDL